MIKLFSNDKVHNFRFYQNDENKKNKNYSEVIIWVANFSQVLCSYFH